MSFDPQAFLDATISEPNEKRPPLPTESGDAGGWYTATIGEVKPNSGVIQNGERTGQPWLSMLVPLKIEVPPALQDALKLPPTVTITDRAFLDLTPAGTIDNAPGRNRRQKQYREACDLNKPGDTFSWRQLQGRVVKVKVSHRVYEGEVQEDIEGVFKL